MRGHTALDGTTRRKIVQAAAAALGTSAVAGSAAAHQKYGTNPEPDGNEFNGNHPDAASDEVRLVGYHSMGGVGPASLSGRPSDPHYGGLFELRTHDDIAILSVFSARSSTPDRGLAILDISDFTRAETEAELDAADVTVLSFVRNDNAAGAWMDAKLSDDGKYAFVGQQPYTAVFGELGVESSTDGHSSDPLPASLLALDISDPGNPEVVANVAHEPLGVHNLWHHQIGGEDYVFPAGHAQNADGAYRFDRDAGTLERLNVWDGFTPHDIVVQEDPEYGIPVLYAAHWRPGNALEIFDMSDPSVDDIYDVQLGAFEMERCHHTVPLPGLYDGKRFAIGGQENPSHDEGQSGIYYLVDCDPIADVIAGEEEGPVHLGTASDIADEETIEAGDIEEDRWVLFDGLDTAYEDIPGFEHEAEQVRRGEREPYRETAFADYNLSTHNMDANADGVVVLGHYHAGTRFLQVEAGDDGYSLEEFAYYRRFQPVPEDSTMGGLTSGTPFHWSSVLRNGIAFTGGINAGPQIIRHEASDRLELGGDTPVDADLGLEADVPVATADQAMRLQVQVDADEPVQVRVAIPVTWDVVGGDAHERVTLGEEPVVDGAPAPDGLDPYRTMVTFDGAHTDGALTLFVETDDGSGSHTVGPAEYARPDVEIDYGGGNNTTNRLWRKENDAVVDVGTIGIDI